MGGMCAWAERASCLHCSYFLLPELGTYSLHSACNCAILCGLNLFFSNSCKALGCVFYIVSMFSGIHRNNTESASHLSKKNVLRANLEQALTSFGHNSHALNQYYLRKSTEVELLLSLCQWTRFVAAQETFVPCLVYGTGLPNTV